MYRNTTGFFNTAVGEDAMYRNTTGFNNTAVGEDAGRSWTTGNFNIAIGSNASGSSTDSGVIRIGIPTGSSAQQKAFIAGIANASGTFNDQDVCIESTGQLGPCGASSARFKTDVEPLAATPKLADLQPVSFRYLKEVSGEEEPMLRYGLIAEQVAEIFPSLVGYDTEGRPSTVRYDLLTPLLLAEIQRQEGETDTLRRQGNERDRVYRRELAELERRLDRLSKRQRLR
jgi:hypothetical protein